MKSNLLFATLKRALAYEPYVYEGDPNNPLQEFYQPPEQCDGSCCITMRVMRRVIISDQSQSTILPIGMYELVTARRGCIPCNLAGARKIYDKLYQVFELARSASTQHNYLLQFITYKQQTCETLNPPCVTGPVTMVDPDPDQLPPKEIIAYINVFRETEYVLPKSEFAVVSGEILRIFNTTPQQQSAINQSIRDVNETQMALEVTTALGLIFGGLAAGAVYGAAGVACFTGLSIVAEGIDSGLLENPINKPLLPTPLPTPKY